MPNPLTFRPAVGQITRIEVDYETDDPLATVEVERIGKHGAAETWRGLMSADEIAAVQAEFNGEGPADWRGCLQAGIDLIDGDLTGLEWKRACREWTRTARELVKQ